MQLLWAQSGRNQSARNSNPPRIESFTQTSAGNKYLTNKYPNSVCETMEEKDWLITPCSEMYDYGDDQLGSYYGFSYIAFFFPVSYGTTLAGVLSWRQSFQQPGNMMGYVLPRCPGVWTCTNRPGSGLREGLCFGCLQMRLLRRRPEIAQTYV